MHYITNHTDQIIAADDSLLELLHVESIEELSKQMILDTIHFTAASADQLEITTDTQTLHFNSHVATLSSLVGELKLISLEQVSEDQTGEEDSLISILDDTPLPETKMPAEKEEIVETPSSALDDDLIFIKEEEKPTTMISPKEEDTSFDDLNLLDLTEIPEQEAEAPSTEVPEDELFELTIPQSPEETIDEIAQPEVETVTENVESSVPETPDTSPIVINISEISETIGISTDDYKVFLNEYIDTAIALEDDLKSNDSEKRSSAVASLSQISEVLQLPYVNEIMSEVSLDSLGDKDATVESFYGILSRLVTSETPATPDIPVAESEISPREATEPKPETLTIQEPEPTTAPELEVETPAEPETKGFGTIDLSDVKPIHFDFQLEEAANDLSLPVELIEEFVHDFIEQAHTETNKMLKFYEDGNLDAIQKIGHMLKGASSNLRINALSDTLYQIQFCEDSSKLEGYIKQYWGHFLSFEQQINILSK